MRAITVLVDIGIVAIVIVDRDRVDLSTFPYIQADLPFLSR